ncbi:carbohydrate porin [Microbulbifer sp. JMSA008]|jgi:porin|uniref:carbohydrate porin n=1 Tax=Microbulbifer sp. JMSA008 TaxID=3243373 RepID=UPI0040390F73
MQHKLEWVIAVIVLVCATSLQGASAQNVEEAAPSYSYCLRPSLFDWPGGLKHAFRERGIKVDAWLTQFYQGVLTGDGDKTWQYGGKGDLIVNLDMSKLGLWRGLSVNVHQEWIFGDDVNDLGNGELLPFNTALAFPRLGGSDRETSITLSQAIGDRYSLTLGKFYMFDVAAKKPLIGGGGLDTFMNIGLAAPISGVTPPYLFGAIGKVKADYATFTLMVYDPRNAQMKEVIRSPFAEGKTTSLSATFPTKINDQKGFYTVRGVYSSKKGLNLSTIPSLLDLPAASESILTRKGYWYLSTSVQQYLYHYPGNPDIGWGLFAEGAISDGNPNPLKWHFLAGVGGQGLFPGRQQDRWGIGYFKYGLSNQLIKGLARIGSTMPFNPEFFIRDEQGIELFYNMHLAPWLRITGDLQWVRPHELSRKRISVAALRWQIRF